MKYVTLISLIAFYLGLCWLDVQLLNEVKRYENVVLAAILSLLILVASELRKRRL